MLASKVGDKFKSPFSNNYRYDDDVRNGISFEQMGIEAQASMIADYYRAVQGKPGRYLTLPVELYQSIIPESYVPSYGRPGQSTSKRAGTVDGTAQSQREIDSRDHRFVEDILMRGQALPEPRPKPRTNALSEMPATPDLLRSRVHRVLRPPVSVSPERIDPEKELVPVPLPRKKPLRDRAALGTGKPVLANPFDLERPELRQQAEMLERNPLRARQMILAAGRDPELFRV